MEKGENERERKKRRKRRVTETREEGRKGRKTRGKKGGSFVDKGIKTHLESNLIKAQYRWGVVV